MINNIKPTTPYPTQFTSLLVSFKCHATNNVEICMKPSDISNILTTFV